MPNSKQRRDAARRHLERQLANRQQRDARRRKSTLIATIIGTLVVAVVVVTALLMTTRDNKSSKVAASNSASPSSSTASSTAPASSPAPAKAPLPARAPTKIAARAAKKTTGPCKYAENAATLTAGNLFDVGLPPDPSPSPTTPSTATFVTNLGTIEVTMDAAGAPCNVQSIKYLIEQKFYDGTACPRSVSQENFYVVQCGDPSATTSGGPTYTTKDENLKNAKYPAGTLAMANSGANTNGSQFFFIPKDSTSGLVQPGTTPAYTVIGHITKGIDILQKVVQGGDDGSNSAGGGRPKIDLIFSKVTVS